MNKCSRLQPREKLMAYGVDTLSDAELLAIILRRGLEGLSANELAHQLLSQAGGLVELFQLESVQAQNLKGIGPVRFIEFQAVLALGNRFLRGQLRQKQWLTSVEDAKKLFTYELKKEQREVFACAFLNQQHQLLAFEKLFWGSVNAAQVYPREILKRVLAHNAAAVIVGHNHPSGLENPSENDISITHKIQKALEFIDVKLLDHFIVGNTTLSLAEQGKIF